ncbi:MAG: anhydro-N-acetylmuramic acid kinase, partial [Flavobacteriales bacterium]
YHEPAGRGTRAVGDGTLLTRTVGLPVVADYRSADVVAGGQGAPLVPLFDSVVLSGHGACLNLGGIANLTWLPQSADDPVRAADLCGANLLLNRQARRAGLAFDRDGDLARRGTVQPEALARLQQWPYLHREGPKSLAAEDLDPLHEILDGIPDPRNSTATAVEWVART